MKTLNKLYPYLNDGELLKGEQDLIKILLKIRKFSDKQTAQNFIRQTFEKKAAGQDLESLECEVVTFFNRIKREKSPMYQALKSAKSIHRAVPVNSKVTFKQ